MLGLIPILQKRTAGVGKLSTCRRSASRNSFLQNPARNRSLRSATPIAWYKRDRESRCQLWSHEFGFELRLMVGELMRSQVCKSSDEVLDTQDCAIDDRRRDGRFTRPGGDPDLFVFHRKDLRLRFFVEVKLEDFTKPRTYRDTIGDQQLFLFPLVEKRLKCPVRIVRVQVVDVG